MATWIDPDDIPINPGAPLASTAVGGAITGDLQYLFENGLYVSGLSGVPPIPNNSFEQDANNTPGSEMSSWVWAAGTGGTGVVTNTYQRDGAQSFQMTQPNVAGQTAGTLTSPFLVCNPDMAYRLVVSLYCTRADVENNAAILYYDANQNYLTSDVGIQFPVNSSPTQWYSVVMGSTPPANAMFMKIQLQGGQNATQPPQFSTEIYWDGVYLFPYMPLSQRNVYTNSGNVFTTPAGCHHVSIDFYSGTTKYIYELDVNPRDTITLTWTNAGPAFTYTGMGNVNLAINPTAQVAFNLLSGSGSAAFAEVRF